MKKNLSKVSTVRYGMLTMLSVLLTLFSCSKDSGDDTNDGGGELEKDIIAFTIDGVAGDIDQDSLTIEVVLPVGTPIGNFSPIIEVSEGATVSPESGEEVDFSNSVNTPVIYTVTAADETIQEYEVTVVARENDAKDIIDFTINEVEGDIDQDNLTIEVVLPVGTPIGNFSPIIEITGVSVDPESGEEVDFSNSVNEPVIYTVTAADDSTQEYEVTVVARENDAKDIIDFTINEVAGDIDQDSLTIEVVLPAGTPIGNFSPIIEITGVSVDPESGEEVDFSNSVNEPVIYTVTAEDDSTQEYEVTVRADANNDAEIITFDIDGGITTIDQDNRTIEVVLPEGTPIGNFSPTITVSEGATVSPESGEEVDFSNSVDEPVVYTVTAEDDSTQEYEVTVRADANNDAEIITFDIDGGTTTIDQNNNTIEVEFPEGTSIGNFSPTVVVSEGATVSPESGESVDFSNSVNTPIIYTVTAENGDTREYEVIVRAFVNNGFILAFEGTTSITIPINPDFAGQYNYEVDSNNDGIFEGPFTGEETFNFQNQTLRTISIRGDFPAIQFGTETGSRDIARNLVSIQQWGNIAWQSMEMAFKNCENLIVNADDVPNLQSVEDMSSMFEGATQVTLSGNQTSLRDWNTGNVTDMSQMFRDAVRADPDVTDWNVSSVTNMARMFQGATAANPNVADWNVSSVTDMTIMFQGTTAANPNVADWNVSSVTDMARMFQGAKAANPNVADWNVSSVTDMDRMFQGATAANPNVADWNVSSVTNMASMFKGATIANPPVNDWNVDNVEDMSSMFENSSLDQEIRWKSLNAIVSMERMFDNCKMSTKNFNVTLYVFGSSDTRDVELGANGRSLSTFNGTIEKFDSHAKEVLDRLEKTLGWTVVGDSGNGSSGVSADIVPAVERLIKAGIIDASKF